MPTLENSISAIICVNETVLVAKKAGDLGGFCPDSATGRLTHLDIGRQDLFLIA